MQYTPLAIATVATEATQRCLSAVQPEDRELVARIWSDLTSEVAFDSITGRVESTQDASSWQRVILDVLKQFLAWRERHAMTGSLVDYVGSVVLGTCLAFVSLER